MDALKAVETLRLAFFTMAKTTCLVLAAVLTLLLVDPTVENTGILDMTAAGLPLADLAFLVGIPTGLFLLGCASGVWEKKLREKKKARKRESLREALSRIPPGGSSGGGPEDNSPPEGRPPPPGDLP
jgi:hypothetical protein